MTYFPQLTLYKESAIQQRLRQEKKAKAKEKQRRYQLKSQIISNQPQSAFAARSRNRPTSSYFTNTSNNSNIIFSSDEEEANQNNNANIKKDKTASPKIKTRMKERQIYTCRETRITGETAGHAAGGQLRAFEMNIYDEQGRAALHFTRPLQNDAKCCCFTSACLCEPVTVWWLQCTSIFNKQQLQRIFVKCPMTNQVCGTVCQIYEKFLG